MSDALMLGVSGLRGVAGTSLTAEVACRYAGAFGSWVMGRRAGRGVRVVIGRDGRRGGEAFHRAAVAGLMGAGCGVVDLGVAMTPTVAVMCDEYGRRLGAGALVAGMVATASHNPREWNGLKCLWGEGGFEGSSVCAPAAGLAEEVVGVYRGGGGSAARWDGIGGLSEDGAGAVVHVGRVLSALESSGVCGAGGEVEGMGEGLRVVVDSVNASGTSGARELLESVGVEETLYVAGEGTGEFPHAPEPTRENLAGLCEAVRESGAGVGFAQDPDGDRLAVVDERGVYVGEEYTLALGCLALLEAARRRGERTEGMALSANLSTSRMIDDIAARYGARVVRTAVGEAHVAGAMKREGALAGGEGNGGMIWPRVTYVRDSLSGMALVMSLLRGGERRLSEVVSGLPAYAIEKRKTDLASKEAALPALERLARVYGARGGAVVDRQDGVRVDFAGERAWVHVRASNTEPIMRLIAEAPTAVAARALLDEVSGVVSGG
ncbi:MAG: phosphoglucosamine mutase [Phycisphaeraceae bacterium]|nr:MAG: phosphoglucosamine mutase [Phycisphaeraceae bacterium]